MSTPNNDILEELGYEICPITGQLILKDKLINPETK